MVSTPGSVEADGPAEAAPGRRAPLALVTYAFIMLILAIVAVLLVVKVTRGATTVPPPPVSLAPEQIVQDVGSVAPATFNLVGAPAPAGAGPVVLTGQPSLVLAGRPGVVYVGSEFCPYCAAARWGLVVALSRFGTFGHLGQTSSSPFEAFPQVQTFSFDGSTYRSRYLTLSAVEEYGQSLSPRTPAGFRLLHSPSALARSLMTRYGGAQGDSGATEPFIDIGNRVVMEGAGIGFSPAILEGLTMGQIADDLTEPTSPVAQAVLGTANEITAAVCLGTGEKPGNVCRSAGVRAGRARLGL
jgi:hypothetical protein